MPEQLEPDPMAVLARWVAEADAAGLPLPSTMTLATTGPDGPHARTVLVTAVGPESLRFHTSTPTTKTRDLAADPRAAAVFHWPGLGRQAILTGTAAELDAAVSASAYPTRPRQLQLLAWAYEALLPGLEAPYRLAEGAVESAFGAAAADPGSDVAPPSWTTIAFTPGRVDFWQAGTEVTPPRKTRYELSASGWRSFGVLP